MRFTILPLLAVLVLGQSVPAGAGTVETSAGPVAIEEVAGGLDEPWGLAFLPDGSFLVTERGGRLTRFGPDGARTRIGGVPKVWARGQGGLFDVLVPRDFATTGEVLLSYATPQGRGAGTAVARARLEGDRLLGLHEIWAMPPGTSGGRHFGGRLVEAPDGALFLTIGERGEGMPAQDPGRLTGKIIRIDRDGRPAAGNPVIPGAAPEIWSMGHRNPQGATLDAAGQLWVNEHGARGGDEVNRIRAGANYGWPVISYGRDYDGSKIGEGTARPGLEQPAHYWDPSIAPSGLLVYSGRLWPDWAGDFFSGSLKLDHVSRLDPDSAGPGGWAEERIAAPETARVRDIREAPDGSIWFLSVDRGRVFRMAPAN